jgi:hypothetical protein
MNVLCTDVLARAGGRGDFLYVPFPLYFSPSHYIPNSACSTHSAYHVTWLDSIALEHARNCYRSRLKGGGEYQAPLASSINKRLFNMAHRISDGTGPMPIFQMLGLNKSQMGFVRSLSACLSFRFSEIVPGDNGWIKCLILLCTRVAQSLGSGSHLGLLRSPIPSRLNDSHIRRFPATEALCVFHGQRKKLAIALQSYRVTCGDLPSRPWIRFHTVQRPCVTDTAR